MGKVLFLFAIFGGIFLCFVWVLFKRVKSKKKDCAIDEPPCGDVFTFIPKFYTKNGWYGYFYDGTVMKYGIVNNLSEDELSPLEKIRVFTTEMKDGVWDLVAMKIDMTDFPENAAIAIESGYCIYPNATGVARVAELIASKVPEKGILVKVEKISADTLRFVKYL